MKVPRPNQTVLIRWRRRSKYTDGKNTHQGDWEEMNLCDSRFITKTYPSECGFLKHPDGKGWFTYPDNLGGHENEVLEWIGFDLPDRQELDNNRYEAERAHEKEVKKRALGKLTEEEILVLRLRGISEEN